MDTPIKTIEETSKIEVDKGTYPEVQGRITKWFGTKRVDHCYGENMNAWKDHFRHWIEIQVGDDIIRGSQHLYDQVAYLMDEGRVYIAFSGYYSGELPIEQPLCATIGVD